MEIFKFLRKGNFFFVVSVTSKKTLSSRRFCFPIQSSCNDCVLAMNNYNFEFCSFGLRVCLEILISKRLISYREYAACLKLSGKVWTAQLSLSLGNSSFPQLMHYPYYMNIQCAQSITHFWISRHLQHIRWCTKKSLSMVKNILFSLGIDKLPYFHKGTLTNSNNVAFQAPKSRICPPYGA